MTTGPDPETTASIELERALYEQLRRMARKGMRDEPAGHTLQATALVHEAYIRVKDAGLDVRGTSLKKLIVHQFRRVLVDWARRKRAAARGGEWRAITLTTSVAEDERTLRRIDVLDLDDALLELARHDAREDTAVPLAPLIQLRFFGGLSNEEIATEIGRSLTTVEKGIRKGKAFLFARLRAS